MAGKAFAQGRGFGRGRHSPSALLGRETEDGCLQVQQLLGGADGDERVGGVFSDLERHSLAFLVGLGPAQLQKRSSVVAELDICPCE